MKIKYDLFKSFQLIHHRLSIRIPDLKIRQRNQIPTSKLIH